MTVLRSVSWDDSKKRRRVAVAFGALILVLPLAPASRVSPSPRVPVVTVIVEAVPGALDEVRGAITDSGGAVTREIGLIHSLIARVPASAIGALRAQTEVSAVALDGPVRLHSTPDNESPDDREPYDPSTDKGSMWQLDRAVGARSLWAQGVTGRGVDVALIDSGVVPVAGLDSPAKIVNGPDLSFESQSTDLRYLDTFGHGTHVAGIIAGNDDPGGDHKNPDSFTGVAPDARILSVKVADAVGATDVSQVLAGIDWVVQHRDDHGLHIRVLNLSFGTDSVQADDLDPLQHAVEVAWRAGIVVVAAAGNRGAGSPGLDDPARSSHVIAVGADDTNGTPSTGDDSIPAWSSSGDGVRNPDVVAPGKSVVSLRDPGSYIDQQYPGGRVDSRYFRGSGTSTSTAVVSGVVALLLQQRPDLTPDQVKAVLASGAHRVPATRSNRQGAGVVNARDASWRIPVIVGPDPSADTDPSEGAGSLEAARGSVHVARDGVELAGEQDIFGAAWDGGRWAQQSSDGVSWTGGNWNGNQWTGDDWSGSSWSGPAWAAADWSASSPGGSWTGNSWSGNSWSGSSWSGNSWSGNSWSGNSWSFMEGDP